MKRNIYLTKVPLDKAKERFFQTIKWDRLRKIEVIPTKDAMGYVTASPIRAKFSSPPFNSAAMDGIAVKAEDTYTASDTHPIRLRIGTDALYIDTGMTIPDDYNAVIMIEDIVEVESGAIEIYAPAAPWQHVRTAGEDMVTTEIVLTTNHLIRPWDIGAILSAGVLSIQVWRKPCVHIIPTGNELVEPQNTLEKGYVFETNSQVLISYLDEWGATHKRWPIIPDNFTQIKETVVRALEDADTLVISAGSSAGRKDFTADIITELGKVLVHGVTIMPGKPLILGIINDKPVVGVPGYPVAAIIVYELILKDLVYNFTGKHRAEENTIPAYFPYNMPSRMGTREFIRVCAGEIDGRNIAFPLPRGSGVITSLVRANGIVQIPEHTEGISEEEKIDVHPVTPYIDSSSVLLFTGSHDMCIDILRDELMKLPLPVSMSTHNIGSLGGITAIKKGITHVAGIHLLDEKSGEYNIPFIEKYIQDIEVILINLVYREQGFIVARGNPKRITDIEDLCRKDINFINRQRGAGTRLLLDYKLKLKGIEHKEINGYDNQCFTHMAVAIAVSGGVADVGLGILAAAAALDLDFIPLGTERYDLVVAKKHMKDPRVNAALDIIRSEKLQVRIENELAGYDTSDTGRILYQTGH